MVDERGLLFFDCPGVVYPHTGMKSRTMGKAAGLFRNFTLT